MAKGYKNIFWGVFLATFNISLGPIKIVPAFVGWMLVLSGINVLRESYESRSFDEAARYNKYLMAISLLGSLFSLFSSSFLNSSILFSYISMVPNLFEVLLVFKIIEGSINYLQLINKESLSQEFVQKQRAYTIFWIIINIGLIMSLTIYSRWLMGLMAMLAVILRIYVMTMVSKLSKI